MKAKLSRRSALGGMLAAFGGLLGWLSPAPAAAGSRPAGEMPVGNNQAPGVTWYSYDADPIARAAGDRSGPIVERFTYDCQGRLVAHVWYV